MRIEINGIGASPGIAIGRIIVFKEHELKIPIIKLSETMVKKETEKLSASRETSRLQLLELRDRALNKMGQDKADIFNGHITMLEDDELFCDTVEIIRTELIDAASALKKSLINYEKMISDVEDSYIKERASDLRDIGGRWLRNIAGVPKIDLGTLPNGTIIAAKDLAPSDTAQLDSSNIAGFITEYGGKTSHSAIMARTLEIPAIVGTKELFSYVKDGNIIIIDGKSGTAIINPDKQEIKKYEEEILKYHIEKEELAKLLDVEAATTDGYKAAMLANIGKPSDADSVLKYGAEGIGLFRTEFLFMEDDKLPSEEEQYEAYKSVAEKLGGRPVTIRTMDIGGDKELPCLNLPKEMNPFLGWRALRICLDRHGLFKTQLRAILRASVFGKIKIMYPMVISISEIIEANRILDICKEELRAEGISFDNNIETGIMIETPAAVIMAEKMARYADFFSIGTNDLTQYILAVDRGNENIVKLYNPYNPAVLNSVKAIIDGAHKAGIKVSMCGELAGDEKAAGLLMGLGLDAFSMSASSIPRVKKKILGLSGREESIKAEKILEMETTEEIEELANN